MKELATPPEPQSPRLPNSQFPINTLMWAYATGAPRAFAGGPGKVKNCISTEDTWGGGIDTEWVYSVYVRRKQDSLKLKGLRKISPINPLFLSSGPARLVRSGSA